MNEPEHVASIVACLAAEAKLCEANARACLPSEAISAVESHVGRLRSALDKVDRHCKKQRMRFPEMEL